MPIAKKERRGKARVSGSTAAVDALGPIGYVFRSGSTARLLSVFVEKPDTRFALSDLAALSQVPRATAQAGLRPLLRANLIIGTGRGNSTRYYYPADQELPRAARILVQVSRNQAAPAPEPAIPWLANVAAQRRGAEICTRSARARNRMSATTKHDMSSQ